MYLYLFTQDVLHEKFSPFGALYEIQIMDGNHGNQVLSDKKQAVPANELKQTSGGPNQTSGDPNQTSGVPNQTSGGPNQTSGGPNQTSVDPNQSSGGLYAFVKFYSARSAARAKRGLTGRLFVSGQHMRVIQFGIYVAPGLGFDRSKLVLAGTGGLNRIKLVKTGQNWSKLINWPQRLTK